MITDKLIIGWLGSCHVKKDLVSIFHTEHAYTSLTLSSSGCCSGSGSYCSGQAFVALVEACVVLVEAHSLQNLVHGGKDIHGGLIWVVRRQVVVHDHSSDHTPTPFST